MYMKIDNEYALKWPHHNSQTWTQWMQFIPFLFLLCFTRCLHVHVYLFVWLRIVLPKLLTVIFSIMYVIRAYIFFRPLSCALSLFNWSLTTAVDVFCSFITFQMIHFLVSLQLGEILNKKKNTHIERTTHIRTIIFHNLIDILAILSIFYILSVALTSISNINFTFNNFILMNPIRHALECKIIISRQCKGWRRRWKKSQF